MLCTTPSHIASALKKRTRVPGKSSPWRRTNWSTSPIASPNCGFSSETSTYSSSTLSISLEIKARSTGCSGAVISIRRSANRCPSQPSCRGREASYLAKIDHGKGTVILQEEVAGMRVAQTPAPTRSGRCGARSLPVCVSARQRHLKLFVLSPALPSGPGSLKIFLLLREL
jgi:hypothetical protein